MHDRVEQTLELLLCFVVLKFTILLLFFHPLVLEFKVHCFVVLSCSVVLAKDLKVQMFCQWFNQSSSVVVL